MRRMFQPDSPSLVVMAYALYFGGIPYDSLVYLTMSESPERLQKAVNRLKAHKYLERGDVTVAQRKVKTVIPTGEAIRWASGTDGFDFFDEVTRRSFGGRSALLRNYLKKPYDTRNVSKSSRRVLDNELMRALCGSGAAMFLARVYKILGGEGLMRHIYPRLGTHPFDPDADLSTERRIVYEPNYIFSYYPAQEAKAYLDDEMRRAASGRAVGYIVAGCGNFQVYYLKNKAAKVLQGAEVRTMVHLSGILKRNTGRELTATLIIARYVDLIKSLIMPKTGGLDMREEREDFMRVNFSDLPTYFVPETQEGAVILSMLLYNNGIENLRYLMCDDGDSFDIRTIDCDYVDKDGAYVLNFLVTDIVRLKKFMVNCTTFTDMTFRIICFEPFRALLEGMLANRRNVSVEVHDVLDVYKIFRQKAITERDAKMEVAEALCE